MKQLSLLLLILLTLSCTQEKPTKETPEQAKEYNYRVSFHVQTVPPLFTKSKLDSLLAGVTEITTKVEKESDERYTVSFLAMDSVVTAKALHFKQYLKKYQRIQIDSLHKTAETITKAKDSLHRIVTELEQEHYNYQILSGFNPEPTGLDPLLQRNDSLHKDLIQEEDSLIELITQSQQWKICNDSMLFFSHKSNSTKIITAPEAKSPLQENTADSTRDSLPKSTKK